MKNEKELKIDKFESIDKIFESIDTEELVAVKGGGKGINWGVLWKFVNEVSINIGA